MEAEKYFEQFTEPLTDEQMARFLTGNGDTAIEEPPALDTEKVEEKVEEPVVEEEPKEEPKEEVKPVIIAKDGVHTIEYEKLVEAREEAKQFKALYEQQVQALADREALIESLKAAQKEDADTGTTEAMDALKASVKEDFPELFDLVTGSYSQVVKELRAEMEDMKKQFSDELAPVMKTTSETIAEKHFGTIRDAHKDFDEIMSGTEITEWIEKHPGPIKEAYQNIIARGTAKDVVDMLTAFKDATKPTAPVGDTTDVAKKAEEAEKKAVGTSVPKSLSDVPAGTAPHHDENEALRNMNPMALMQKFAGKSPDEIMSALDRLRL